MRNLFKILPLFALMFLSLTVLGDETKKVKFPFEFEIDDWRGSFHGKIKPEFFFNKNNQFLNSDVDVDEYLWFRHTLDLTFDIAHGKKEKGYDIAEMLFSVRNRSVWGNPSSIARTTEEEARILNLVGLAHTHSIGRHILWMREMWLKYCINDIFSLSMDHNHYFIIGAFPFQLGRGIALGDAFAVNSTLLGFYTDAAVDQYAFGTNLYGDDLFNHKLGYDFYFAILENKSDNFRQTSAKVYEHEYGRKNDPRRGFGKIDYVIASRLRYNPISSEGKNAYIEPYVLYNNAPEQKVEFVADSSSKLGSIGLTAEFEMGRLEFGFDCALNLGRQKVKGWDRNYQALAVREVVDSVATQQGALTMINDRVYDQQVVNPDGTINPNAKQYPYIPGSVIQNKIDQEIQSSDRNNQEITAGVWNSADRFRDPYVNKYKGWMWVLDGAYWNAGNNLKVAAGVGAASGDENPNKDLLDPNDSEKDAEYRGFIGLQEIYSGQRIKSVFVLEARKLLRPLSAPSSKRITDLTSSKVSEFTNLIFTGIGLHWWPKNCSRNLYVRPNVLAYWQEHSTKQVDIQSGLSIENKYANKYLGSEINIQIEFSPYKNMKANFVSAVFFPGAFYKDVKGKKIASDIRLGNDIAFLMTVGLEYKF